VPGWPPLDALIVAPGELFEDRDAFLVRQPADDTDGLHPHVDARVVARNAGENCHRLRVTTVADQEDRGAPKRDGTFVLPRQHARDEIVHIAGIRPTQRVHCFGLNRLLLAVAGHALLVCRSRQFRSRLRITTLGEHAADPRGQVRRFSLRTCVRVLHL
jgi:hypothetical protein